MVHTYPFTLYCLKLWLIVACFCCIYCNHHVCVVVVVVMPAALVPFLLFLFWLQNIGGNCGLLLCVVVAYITMVAFVLFLLFWLLCLCCFASILMIGWSWWGNHSSLLIIILCSVHAVVVGRGVPKYFFGFKFLQLALFAKCTIWLRQLMYKPHYLTIVHSYFCQK